MKISTIVKIKKGYVLIDTCSVSNPLVNILDLVGIGNSDAIGNPFETMVFSCNKNGKVNSFEDLDKMNYKTEKKAKEGHKKMIKKWRLK